MNEWVVLQRICSFKGILVLFFSFLNMKSTCHYDVGPIKVTYEVTENKLGCVFGNIHLVISISDVGGSSRLTCGIKTDPACRRLPMFTGHFPPIQRPPEGYASWASDGEEGDERNTGHLGKQGNAL